MGHPPQRQCPWQATSSLFPWAAEPLRQFGAHCVPFRSTKEVDDLFQLNFTLFAADIVKPNDRHFPGDLRCLLFPIGIKPCPPWLMRLNSKHQMRQRKSLEYATEHRATPKGDPCRGRRRKTSRRAPSVLQSGRDRPAQSCCKRCLWRYRPPVRRMRRRFDPVRDICDPARFGLLERGAGGDFHPADHQRPRHQQLKRPNRKQRRQNAPSQEPSPVSAVVCSSPLSDGSIHSRFG